MHSVIHIKINKYILCSKNVNLFIFSWLKEKKKKFQLYKMYIKICDIVLYNENCFQNNHNLIKTFFLYNNIILRSQKKKKI